MKPPIPATPQQPISRFNYDDVSFPNYEGKTPKDVWGPLFKSKRPAPATVRNWVTRLDRKKAHKHIIALIESALKSGQSQPWMYEVLALSMEIEGYPKDQVERVILSMTDFGNADFGTMMYSGAYLTRFKRHAAALRMYQQCSRMLPERSEPYVLGLKLAKETGKTADILWAATGVLKHCWTRNYKEEHIKALDLIAEHKRELKRDGKSEALETIAAAIKSASERDVSVLVEWTGGGDLDLQVEEPSSTVCSFENTQTRGGGILLHDGCGPEVSNCYENYVCPEGLSGPYRLTIRKAWGDIVGNRATVTIWKHLYSDKATKIVRTVILEENEAQLTIDLENGRRTQPREGFSLHRDIDLTPLQKLSRNNTRVRRTKEGERALSNLANSRNNGAFGVSPVVQTIPTGSSATGRVVISPDRRYVRIAIQPVFSEVTDVFTFSYLNDN